MYSVFIRNESKTMIQITYIPPAENDGYRILVDRLWPRGESKEVEKIDLWLKEVAPSNELRKWFAHDISKYSQFKIRYQAELEEETAKNALGKLRLIVKEYPVVTLVYGAKDEEHNNARVLFELLNSSS